MLHQQFPPSHILSEGGVAVTETRPHVVFLVFGWVGKGRRHAKNLLTAPPSHILSEGVVAVALQVVVSVFVAKDKIHTVLTPLSFPFSTVSRSMCCESLDCHWVVIGGVVVGVNV